MRTDDLVRALVADAGPVKLPAHMLVKIAAAAGVLISVVVFGALAHPRADFAAAVLTPAYQVKLLVPSLGAAIGAVLLQGAASPLATSPRLRWLAVPVALLAGAVVVELALAPAATWKARMLGHSGPICLAAVSALSSLPALCLFVALRRGAPARPAHAGAIAGLFAGATGATLYAVSCREDSPLFVATWYMLAIAIVVGACAILGSRLLRW